MILCVIHACIDKYKKGETIKDWRTSKFIVKCVSEIRKQKVNSRLARSRLIPLNEGDLKLDKLIEMK